MLDEMDNRGYKVITANSTSEKVSGHIQISYMDSGEIVFEKDDN